MKPEPNHDELERRVHALLRSLPDQTAPEALEARVRARVEGIGPLWWVQAGFVVAALGAMALLTEAGGRVLDVWQGVVDAVRPTIDLVTAALAGTVGGSAWAWWQVGAVAVAIAGTGVAVLGTAAYQTLWRARGARGPERF